jgi:hypothetical protein
MKINTLSSIALRASQPNRHYKDASLRTNILYSIHNYCIYKTYHTYSTYFAFVYSFVLRILHTQNLHVFPEYL